MYDYTQSIAMAMPPKNVGNPNQNASGWKIVK